MQVKATMRCHFTPTRIATVKKKTKKKKLKKEIASIGKNSEKS